MDPIVRKAMAKWPNVPAVYGWLGLDRRGRWLIQGQPLAHRPTIEFINRNYQGDAAGRWYFQNGPQTVFVDLAYTPWIYSLDAGGGLLVHTGSKAGEVRRGLLDDEGSLILVTDLGPGLLDDRDLARLGNAFRDRRGCAIDERDLDACMAPTAGGAPSLGLTLSIDGAVLELGRIASADVARHFGYVVAPGAD